MNGDEATLSLRIVAGGTVHCPECGTVVTENHASKSTIICPVCQTKLLLSHEVPSEKTILSLLDGRIELRELLGKGSFGTVWRGFDNQLNRDVAIKLNSKCFDTQERIRFQNEARSAAVLNHPGIVSVYDFGIQDEQPFLVCELVDGCSLEQYRDSKKLSIETAVELCVKICDALAHAHRAGVVHRDLKPANILIDGQGEPLVADFGLAKRDTNEVTLTMAGDVLGTPAYMSPEQAMGDGYRADPRSDVYSIGVILFELLTGERPFRGSLQAILRQIIHDAPPLPRRLHPSVSRDLETICLKCLEKNPVRRFQSAEELRDELLRVQTGKPIKSRAISRLERGWRWCQRNQQIAILLFAITVVLISGTVVSTVFGYRSAYFGKQAIELAEQRKTLLDDLELRNIELKVQKEVAEDHKTRAVQNAETANARAAELKTRFYHSGLARAWDSMTQRNYRLTRSVLESIKPQQGEADPREIMWHHLWDKLHSYEWERTVFREHIVPINGTNDILLTSRNGYLRFDTQKQVELSQHSVEIGRSPALSSNGQILGSLINPQTLVIVPITDSQKAQRIILPFHFYESGDDSFAKLIFTETPHQVLVSHYSIDKSLANQYAISLFDYEKGKIIQTWAAFDDDFDYQNGQLLFLAPANSTDQSKHVARMTVRDLSTEDELSFPINLMPNVYRSRRLIRWLGPSRIGLAENKRLRLWQVSETGLRKTGEVDLPDNIRDFQFAPETRQILVNAHTGSILQLLPVSGAIKGEIPCFEDSLFSFEVLDKGRSLVAKDRRTLRMFKLNRQAEGAAAWDHLRSSKLGEIVWDRKTFDTKLTWFPRIQSDTPHRWNLHRSIIDLALHPSQSVAFAITFAFSRDDTNLEIIDLEHGSVSLIEDAPLNLLGIDVNFSGKSFLTVGEKCPRHQAGRPTGPLQVRNTDSGKVILEIDDRISFAKFSPAGDRIFAIVEPDSSGIAIVRVYESSSGNVLWETKAKSRSDSARFISFSPDSSLWCTGNYAGEIKIRSLRNYDTVCTLAGEVNVMGAKFVDNTHLMALENYKTLRYWNLTTQEEVFHEKLISASGAPSSDVSLNWFSTHNTLRVEPYGNLYGNLELTSKLRQREEQVEKEIQTLNSPNLEGLDSLAKKFDERNSKLSQMNEDLSVESLLEKLEASRLIHREMKLALIGRENEKSLRLPYAVFLYRNADFVAEFTTEQESKMLRPDETAEIAYRRAEDCWRRLTSSSNPYATIMIAGINNNLARYFIRRKNYSGAVHHAREAVEIQNRVLEKQPDHPTARIFMKNHHMVLIQGLVLNKRFDEVFLATKKMLEFSTEPALVQAGLDGAFSAMLSLNDLPPEQRASQMKLFKRGFIETLQLVPDASKKLETQSRVKELKKLFGSDWPSVLQDVIDSP